jgi:hypothetical protein
VEAAVLMAALALVGTLLAVALGGALKLQKASSRTMERLGTLGVLADQFRADVAPAADAPQRWQENVASPTCLILALGKDHHVVYRAEGKRLVRLEYEGERTRRRELAPKTPLGVEFERSPGGGRLITLRLSSIREDGRRVPSLEIAAALGGDLE